MVTTERGSILILEMCVWGWVIECVSNLWVSCLLDEEMDGEAIMQAFTTCSSPDSLNAIIPTYGKWLKTWSKPHF